MTYYIGDLAFYPSDELEHHGVLGQKWGVRRWQNKDGSLTAAGYEHYGYGAKGQSKGRSGSGSGSRSLAGGGKVSSTKNEPVAKKDAFETMERQTTNVDKGRVINDAYNAFLGGPVGIAYAAVDAIQAAHGIAKTNRYLKDREKDGTIDKETGLYLKNKEMTEAQDCKTINPGLNTFNTGNQNNCVLCSMAYDLRRRGYDVIAGQATEGYSDEQVASWYKKGKLVEGYESPLYKLYESKEKTQEKTTFKERTQAMRENAKNVKQARRDFISNLEKENNTRGILRVRFNNLAGAHAVAYEVKNGKLTIFDGQTGKVYSNPMQLLRMTDGFAYMRTDNLDPDFAKIKKYGGVR